MKVAQAAPVGRERLEEAADWWMRLQDADAPPEDIATWLEWMEADPRHGEAYQRVQELGMRLTATGRGRRERRGTWQRALPLAAALAAVAVTASLLIPRLMQGPVPTMALSTEVAAVEQASLPDGSRVMLGGATSVKALYTDGARELRLEAGEAYFEVRADAPRRPFVVRTGNISVKALGTAFNVRNTLGRVVVTVTEGKVQVARNSQDAGTLEAGAGEQVTYDPATDRFRVAAVDTRRILDWREQRLQFTDEPLDMVIADVNRHSLRQIRVQGVDLHPYTYTGTFRPDRLDEWLVAVGRSFPVHISTRDSEILIGPAVR